ncbi:MAG TPA: Ig-like domain-containing protein [Gemmatimonadaceae bacterium]|nr:Ig-like domain-containing protein [Gemmatimonadaceae bacterium]
MRVPHIRVLGTISLVLLSACSKLAALTGAGAVAVASVVVTPATSTIVSGNAAQFSAVTYDASGQQLAGRVISWSTTNATVASVSSTGLVSASGTGSATITATSEGKSGNAAIIVAAAPPPPPSGAVADPTLLPIAARQLPAFESYAGASLAAGMSYSDPVTGVRVWKATSASVPVANTQATHDYGSGPLQVTRDWGNNQHTILVNVGGHYLVDFTRGGGFSNWRRTPTVNSDLCFTFSFVPATPQIAYFLNGTTLHRYDTRTNAVSDSGNFPKSFASITTSSLLWLQQDRNDEWFVMMPSDQSLVIAWNSVTNVTQIIHATSIDEPHLDRDGRYVAIDLATGAPDWQIYDLQTQSMGAPISKQTHLEALRSAFVSHNPDVSSGPQYYYDPIAGRQVTTLTASQLSPDLQHRSGQWIQADAQLPGASLLKQWYLWSGYSDGVVTDGGWTLSSGQIYWTTPNWGPAYAKPTIGVLSVRQLVDGAPTQVARQLARASSIAGMTEGSFFYDAAATRVYVWTVGGGSPTGRVELRAPGTIHDGIGFVRQDGSDVRLLAHSYSHSPNRYWDAPRATVSADGKVVLFSSNQNDSSGRIDLYVVEVPIH